jgi:8-oxo-dGTP pyrophosphatase MutT (NUDIX family)
VGNDRAALETADLRFALVAADRLAAVRQRGLHDARWLDTFEEAVRQRQGKECILVAGRDAPLAGDQIMNLNPYRAPVAVPAAGGIVLRPGGGADVLLIFRRGAWDLPKGKLDPGESLEACALREVREEVGIARLTLLAPAGTTVHGYPEGERYAVKRTHWFLMETPETAFEPEAAEGIEAAEWVPWNEAMRRLGYASLRRHLRALRPPRAEG